MQEEYHPYDPHDPRRRTAQQHRLKQAQRTAARRARRRAAGCLVLLALCAAGLFSAARWAGEGGARRLLAALEAAGEKSSLSGAIALWEIEDAPAGAAGDSAAGADTAQGGGLFSGIRSTAAVLVALEDGRTIAAQNENEPLPPASLTKLMTVFAALELGLDPGREVTLDAALFPPLWEENASMAGLLPGETVTVEELLYGALLPSGADCCEGLGAAAGGSGILLEEMNRAADRLGMTGSRFENLTGLDAAGHRSTAADLALLLYEALQEEHEPFYTVFTSWSHSCTGVSAHPDGLTFESTLLPHRALLRGEGWQVLGGKTGFTDAAGLCLATLAEVNGREYLLITLGAPGTTAADTAHIEDAALVWSRFAAASE